MVPVPAVLGVSAVVGAVVISVFGLAVPGTGMVMAVGVVVGVLAVVVIVHRFTSNGSAERLGAVEGR